MLYNNKRVESFLHQLSKNSWFLYLFMFTFNKFFCIEFEFINYEEDKVNK